MAIYRTPQGSPVIFFQEPRRLKIYMVAVSRRRRCLILTVICCLALFIFGWYSSTSNNSSNLTEFSTPVTEMFESNNVFARIQISQQFATLEKLQKDTELMDLKESRPQLKDLEEELVSGPTEYLDIPTTRSSKIPSGDMELFSAPTDYGDIPITFPARRYPNLDLEFSEPTEFEMPVTMPFGRKTEVKNKFSRQIQRDMINNTKHVTPPIQNNEIEGSKNPKYDNYPKLSLEGTTPSILNVTQPTKDPSLVLDTPGCKVPKLDPWDPTVKHLIELQEPYECPGPPMFMKPSPDGSIIVNETILDKYYNLKSEDIFCYYYPIYRLHELPGKIGENDFTNGPVSRLEFGVPLYEDYVGIMCALTAALKFEYFFPLVHLKREIEEVRSSIEPPTPRLNIILAGIDSISKLNYLRHFRKTEAFIKEKLNMFEMNGYTKVGDNTFPNLVPMLTGHFVEHYYDESLNETMFFDDIGLIWKDYANKGYRTFYAEDSPFFGTFNFMKRGFYNPPTDYYIRPLLLAAENKNITGRTGKEFCYNSQMEPELIYDYLRNFIEAMENRPYFAFSMVSTITHDFLNNAGWEDEPTVHLLDDLLNMGALNDSLLVLFSDHGLRFGEIRYTYIGTLEERMPFMYIHAPKWFLDQYPQYAKNLAINQDRLMTLFDIHATMIHLLDLNRSPEERASLSMGKSLLEEISPNRTCEDANILSHWCPCQTFQSVSLNSTEAIRASQAIVDDINSKLAEYGSVCEVLEVSKIMDARVGQTNDKALRFVKHDNVEVSRTVAPGDRIEPISDYMITLVTKPGHAVFEGTVRHDPEKRSFTVLGISRISMYGKTSWCISSPKMKIFCYCKVQLTS